MKDTLFSVLDSFSIPVITLNARNQVEAMNLAARELFFGPHPLRDIDFRRERVEETLPWLTEALADFLAREIREHKYEETIQTAKGLRYFEVHLKRILDGDKKSNGTTVVLNDITERQQIEEALKESEKKYKQVVENAQEIIHTTDINGKFTFGNSATLKASGYSLEEFLQLNYQELIHPDHRQRLSEIYVGQFRERKPTIYLEFPILTKSGEVRWLGQNSSLMMEGKKVGGFHSVARDITERKQMEEALRENEEKYRLLFEISTEAILIRDRDGLIRLANPTALKMFKASKPEEIIGKPYLDFVHPDDRAGSVERIQRQIKAVLEEPGIDLIHIVAPIREHRLLTLDGETIYVESTGVAFRHQGQAWIQGIFHDLSRRKQATEDLRLREEEAKRLAQENTIMAEIGRIISSTLEIEEVFDRFAEEVHKLIYFDRLAVNSIDSRDNTFAIIYVAGIDITGLRKGDVFPLAGKAVAEVKLSRASVLIQEETIQETIERFPTLKPIFQGGLRSMIMVPLTLKNEVIGILNVQCIKPNAYTEADVRLAEKVATQIAGAIANSQLFAERQRAEGALKESEEKYRNLFSMSKDAVYLSSKEGRFVDFNQAALDLFGFTREEMLVVEIPKIYMNPDDRKRFQQEIEEQGYLKEYEVKFRKKDGAEIDCLLTATVRHDQEGKILGYQGIIRDITRRKQAEAERERLIQELREALAKVKTLSGLLPICAACKKIRDDKGYWNQIETYIGDHSEVDFSHGMCPDCLQRLYPEIYGTDLTPELKGE